MSLNYAASFSGSNTLNITNYTGNAAAFSVSCWVRLNATQDTRVFVSNYQATGSKGWAVGIRDGVSNQLKFYLGSNTLYQTGTITPLLWTHAIFTWDGTTAKIYLNGNTTPSNTLTSGVSYGTVPTNNYIGSLDGSLQRTNGRLAGVGIWSKALSTAEVTSLYNAGLGLAGSELSGSLLTSLVSYHDFINSGSLGTDSSGNSHTYTNTGTVVQAYGPSIPLGTLGVQAKPGAPVLQSAWSSNMLAAYNLGEGTSTAADLSGNAHTGTLTGSCTWSGGSYGNHLALADNGTTGSYLALGNLASLSGATAYTFSALCQLNTATDSPRAGNLRVLIGTSRAAGGAPQSAIWFNAAQNTIHFNARYTNFPDLIVPAPPLNTWVLITGRVTSNVQSLWYNGTKADEQAVASYAYASDLTPVGALGDIYAQQAGNNWSGPIAMGMFSTVGRTDAEIAALTVDPFVWDRIPGGGGGAPLLAAS